MEKYAAIILAAGKGTRMNEGQVSPIPKVMFQVLGKPIISYGVEAVKEAGLKKVILVVGYQKEMVMDYFGNSVEYAIQEEQLGTGHAVMMAEEKVKDATAIMVFCGDHSLWRPETINKLIEAYENDLPTIAMLSVHFNNPDFWGFGRIIRHNTGEVDGIIEQKDCTEQQRKITESNPSFYIFNAEWLWQNIHQLKTENVQKEYYLTDLIALARSQNKKIIAVPVADENEAHGINSPEQLIKAEEILKTRNVNV